MTLTPILRSLSLVVALLAAAALAGCGAIPGLAQIEGATVVATEKPLSDHLMSFLSGKNCSVIRREKGQTYCEEDELRSAAPKVYCYRSIGGVNCYDRPDPFDGQSYKALEETPPPAKPPVR